MTTMLIILEAFSWQVRRQSFAKKTPWRSMSLLIIWLGGSLFELEQTCPHNWNFHTVEIFTPTSWPRSKDWKNQRMGIGLRFTFYKKSSSWFEVLSKSNIAFSRLYFFPSTKWVEITYVHHRWWCNGSLMDQDSSVQGNSPSLKVLGTENFI